MTSTIRSAAERHPATSYFVLTFVISWASGVAIIASGSTGLMATPEEFGRLLPVWVPLLVLGPCLSGFLLTWVVGGRAGLRAYRSRLFAWRRDGHDYALALLAAPVYFLATALAFAAFDAAYLPALVTTDDPAALVVRGLAIALTAGIFEELGWTGFAVPALRRRHGATVTGGIVGVLWGLWHFFPKIWGAAANGVDDYMALDLASAVVGLTGFRILMVWVYDRTGGSLPIAISMHLGLTASTLILQPALSGGPFVVFLAVLAVVPWLIVSVVLIGRSWHRHERHGHQEG
jgi:hypothetical protein